MKNRFGLRIFLYSVAVATIALACWVRYLLHSYLGSRVPFATFFPAVVFIAFYAGYGPALLAIILSGLAAAYLFIPPGNSLLPNAAGWVELSFFTGLGVAVTLGIEWMRRLLNFGQHDGDEEFPHRQILTGISTVRQIESRLAQDTQTLQIQTARSESEERFRSMANITPAILWTAAPDGTITWASDRWFEYTGISREKNPRDWSQVLHPDDVEPCLKAWSKALAEGTPYEIEVRNRRHNGEYRWFLTRAIPIHEAEGGIREWYGTTTDIHHQKQMEQSQRFLAEVGRSLATVVDYKSTLQIVAELCVPTFADWCAIDMRNERGTLQRLAIAHVDPAKISLVEDLARCSCPNDIVLLNPRKVFQTGKSVLENEVDFQNLCERVQDEGCLGILEELHPKSFILVPLRIEERYLGAITFATSESGRQYEASDLVLAEDLAHQATIAIENSRLYQSIRDNHQRKDEFLAMLAHELRNPLAPIRSGLDILALDENCDRETVTVMQHQLEHVVRLVDDLLDVSRIMRNKMELRKELVDLCTLARRSVEAIGSHIDRQRQELIVSLPREPVWVKADPVRLIQVIENLLNNASKYTEERGRIELTVDVKSDEAAIRVQDSGVGIEPDLLPSIFELFTQSSRSLERSQGGLGIGLTLVHRLVQMHGGIISARSDGPGLGSTFNVRLPLAEHPPPPETATEHAPQAQSRRIVVVDDNVGAAMLLSKLLEKLGDHQVVTAHDGTSALETICEMHPEIVLLDIGLPGMNGYEVAQAIRQKPEFDDVLLVALTGFGQKEDRLMSRQAGFDEHYVKPPSLDQMKNILNHSKLKTVTHRSGTLDALNSPESQHPRAAKPAGFSRDKSPQESSTALAIMDLRQIKHDIGNVVYVLSLMTDMYLIPKADDHLREEAKQVLANEISKLRSMVEALQRLIDMGQS